MFHLTRNHFSLGAKMDSLLTTLISVLLAETGDRTQILAAVLALRFHNDRRVLAGLALATVANCTLSAVGGSLIDGWISEAPLRLLNGLAYIFAGIGMLLWRRPVDVLQTWKTGAFMTSFTGLFILQFGDKSQFIIAANAGQTPLWGMALIGGILGILTACVPAILFRDTLATMLPLRFIRIAGGVALTLWGLLQALRAFGLIEA
jgi:Ca2+/H+ antiporter, TMEM165/GDT1 family